MWGGTDERESIRTIHAALDIGINLIDTAPVYGFGVSEEIVGKAIEARGHREKVFIATKVGVGERVMRLKSRDRRRTQRPHLDWDLTNFEPTTRLSSCVVEDEMHSAVCDSHWDQMISNERFARCLCSL